MTDGRQEEPEATSALERAALRLAEGEAVDWAETLEMSPESEQMVASLRKLEAIFSGFVAADGDPSEQPGEGSAAEAESGVEEPLPAQPEPGLRWGHLQVGEKLGQGSFGEVYRAHDPLLQRDVALKLRRGDGRETESSRRYIEEARRLARVRHPHVLAVHGADVHEGRVGLWADLLEGETLEEVIGGHAPLLPTKVVTLGHELAEALAEVHKRGLVHGDVKGSNVMLEPSVGAVLMDFGAASDAAFGSEVRYGSPLSMAPELFAGEAASPQSDQYAFGVLLHRLLTGRYPVEGESLAELRSRHAERARELVFPARVPQSLRRLTRRLLAAVPAERPTAEEALQRFDRIRTAPARRRRVLAVAAVIASLAAGTVAATVGFVRADRARQETAAVNDFLTDMLGAPRPIADGPNVRMIDVLNGADQGLDERFADQPRVHGMVLHSLSVTFDSLSEHSRAEDLARRAVELSRTSFGPVAPETRRAEMRLVSVLIQQNELDEAEEYLGRALSSEQQLPRGSSEAYKLRDALSYVAHRRGRLEEALEWRDAAIEEIGASSEGSWREHDGRLALIEKGSLLNEVGRLEEAVVVLREVLPRQLESEGERDSNTILARSVLGRTLTQLGYFAEAEEVLRPALDAARDWLGPDFPETLDVLNTLAGTVQQQGRAREAANMLAESLAQLRADPGEHAYTLPGTLVNYSSALLDAGDYEAAEPALREAIELLVDRYGATDINTLVSRYNLAELLYRDDRPGEAIDLPQLVADTAEALGTTHPVALVSSSLDAVASAATRGSATPSEVAQALAAEEGLRTALGGASPITLQATVFLHDVLSRSADGCDEARNLEARFAEDAASLKDGHWLRTAITGQAARCTAS